MKVEIEIARKTVALLLLMGATLWAGDGGSLLGTITDPSGKAIVGAKITATGTATSVNQKVATDARGFYSFQSLPVGRYDVEIDASGFKPLRRTDVVIDIDSKAVVDAALTIGERTDTVTVSESAAHVETVDTQMGQVITGKQMTSVPLNGRSYTDLLALQSGVVPVTSLTSDTQQDVGVSAFSPSGGLNPGTISINGQREFANSFVLNGSDVEEDVNMGAAIVPNLDSIAEFRILTSNFDAEYGEFSGGQIGVVTKSGTNAFHGDALRIPAQHRISMPAIIFLPRVALSDQNQFGGTVGGPIRKNKVFFFARLSRHPLDARNGYRSDPGAFASGSKRQSVGSREFFHDRRSERELGTHHGQRSVLGQPAFSEARLWRDRGRALLFPRMHQPGAVRSYRMPRFRRAPGPRPPPISCSTFPRPTIRMALFRPPPTTRLCATTKAHTGMDGASRWGMLSAYYFLDDWSQNNPYPVAQGGANVPGFNALNFGRAQLLALGDTKTLGPTAVNEFHFSFMRDATDLGQPVGGVGTSLASQGFVVGPNTPASSRCRQKPKESKASISTTSPSGRIPTS